MPHRFAQSRLIAHVGIRQVEVHLRADAVAAAVDNAIAKLWRETVLAGNPQAFAALVGHVASKIDSQLEQIATWGYRTAKQAKMSALPTSYLRYVAMIRARAFLRRERVTIHEAAADDIDQGGGIELLLKVFGLETGKSVEQQNGHDFIRSLLQPVDRLAPLREPARAELSDEQQRELFAKLLFRPPTQARVNAIVYSNLDGENWSTRWARVSKLAAPERLADVVSAGYAAGKSQRQIAKDLEPIVDNVRVSATRIARTEGLRVAHATQMITDQQVSELRDGYQIHATLDQNTRAAHAARNGSIWYGTPNVDAAGVPSMPLAARHTLHMTAATLPDEPNCLLPGTRVQGEFVAGFKAQYSGKVIELRCGSGATVRVTANHPIATSQGFVPAYSLTEGQQVLSHVVCGNFLSDNERYGPSVIENVFRAIKQFSWPVSHTPARNHFYGDGLFMNGQVEIVVADRPLPFDLDSKDGEGVRDDEFRGVSVNTFEIPGAGTCTLNRLRVPTAASGSLGSIGLGFANGSGSLRPFYSLGFGPAAKFDASRYDQTSETASPTSASDAQFVGKLLERFSGKVSLDYVVQVRCFDWSGHVYDLQGVGGWIVANNIVVSNCRCVLVPVLKPAHSILADPAKVQTLRNAAAKTIPDPDVYTSWFAAADERRRRLAVGARRYQAVVDRVGDNPSWSHFVNPDTGELMGLKDLRSEKPLERARRTAAVDRLIGDRRELLAQVRTFGFALPQPV